MATKIVFHPLALAAPHVGPLGYSNGLRAFAFLIGLCICSLSARAQLQQPFVFSANPANPKSVAAFTRNDVTGILTPVPGSPFPSLEPVNVMTLDFKGRFLFTASFNPSKISMFTIDPNTGALQEVVHSPFASVSTNDPVFLSTESSGQFLYVINFNGSQAGASSFESFQIDAVNLGLIPSSGGATQLPGLFLSGATHPSGKSFYALLNAPFAATPNEEFFLLFDSSTGKFTIPNPNLGSSGGTSGCCLALDPQGKSLALGASGQITLYSLLADGTLAPNPITGGVSKSLPMAFDTFGRFLYVDFPGATTSSTSVHIFSPVTLLETSNSPLPSSFPSSGTWSVDPTAPLIYADQVYQVDPQTGIPAPILSTSPILKPALFILPPGIQPVLGPIALLSATSLSFGSLSIGQTSSAQTLTITSNGGQALSLNTVAITGPNAGDFALSGDTCHAPTVLQPGQSCSVLVSFTPSVSGRRTAAVTITSNAFPTMESAQLNGTGLTPAPAVTLVPGSLDFGTTTVGSSTPMNVTVTNSGTATLHISSVAIGGANPNDFSFSDPSCNSAILVSASCTITVTFKPLAGGLRTASVILTDDALDSPQAVSVKGNATATPAPVVTVTPSSPDFGTTTQGTSTPLNVTVQNTGTATLHITSVGLGGANGNEFSFSDPTCNAAIPVSGTCTIALTFTPLTTGPHVASVTLADDAPGSPQIINIKGTANPAFSAGAAPGGSTTASVSAGQTAQYQLQLTPGPGYSGTVALTCGGAPLGAACMAPTSVTITAGIPAPFTVSVKTSGSAALLAPLRMRFRPIPGWRLWPLLAFAWVVLLAFRRVRDAANTTRGKRLAMGSALAAVLLFATLGSAGCGAGASTPAVAPPPPPQVVTPSGTSTITLTPSAMSSTGQALQLPPIQLTLIVK